MDKEAYEYKLHTCYYNSKCSILSYYVLLRT